MEAYNKKGQITIRFMTSGADDIGEDCRLAI